MTPLRRYYRGHSLVAMRDVQAAQTRYYHFDHQGTTQALTDSTGAVTDRFAADAWGVQVKRTGSSINRQWYIGNLGYVRAVDQQADYVRLRHLAVSAGRWYSADPRLIGPLETIELLSDASGGGGAYVYVSNEPALAVDPSGAIKIVPVNKQDWRVGNPVTNAPCSGAFAVWDYHLDRPARADGYMVQRVEITSPETLCDGTVVKFHLVFWEAWHVLRGQIYDDHHNFRKPPPGRQPYTDAWTHQSHRPSFGSERTRAEVRFYRQTTTTDLKTDPAWVRGRVRECGHLLCTRIPPEKWRKPFWNRKPDDGEAVDHRGSDVDWDCCRCAGNFTRASASPK